MYAQGYNGVMVESFPKAVRSVQAVKKNRKIQDFNGCGSRTYCTACGMTVLTAVIFLKSGH